MVAGSGIQKYGPQIEEHQQLLLNAADILIEIYLAESAILRTEKNAKRFGEASQKAAIAMTQLYLYEAVEIAASKGKEAIISFAEGDMQRMLLMGLRRFTKYAHYPNVIELKNIIAEEIKAKDGYTFDQ